MKSSFEIADKIIAEAYPDFYNTGHGRSQEEDRGDGGVEDIL